MSRRSMNRVGRVVLGAGVLSAWALAGACSSGTPTRYEAVKADPTPNLDTLYQRPADIDNSVVLTNDENARMFIQDLGRAFYTDRPTRLTREPIPQP
ncbi:MAG TPA: hypothetical protein PL072_06145 [Phycisphaerales bacterium]|nr:hypothetical protein [Phycisphaerales bacterium]HPO93036.1 hypothetical protein [Phycisphaerales bacterium]